MRSFEGPTGRTYLHNSDFSGDVLIPAESQDKWGTDIAIPFADMVALVAEFLREKEIARWENYSNDQIISRLGSKLE